MSYSTSSKIAVPGEKGVLELLVWSDRAATPENCDMMGAIADTAIPAIKEHAANLAILVRVAGAVPGAEDKISSEEERLPFEDGYIHFQYSWTGPKWVSDREAMKSALDSVLKGDILSKAALALASHEDLVFNL